MSVLATVRARLASMLSPVSGGSWYPVVREPYTGAWQNNDPLTTESALANPSVFGAVSRISQDISKIAPPLLLERDRHGFWTETSNPAYSPVLRRPNHYQTAQQFIEMWVLSKVLWGNAYILKSRDERTVVNALHMLDPARVKVLTAPDGSVYYELQSNDLAGMPESSQPVVIPAREIIHDRWNCLYHPLCGVSPLSALAGAVAQAKAIQDNSTTFFAKGARPSGTLSTPTKLDPMQAARLKADASNWKSGEQLILEMGLKYEAVSTTASQSQLIEQLGWTEEKICEVLGLPISILNSSKQPPYANAEASQLQYKSQCLEPHLVSIATCLGDGLDLPSYLTIEFDDALLIWMDTTSRVNAAKTAIGSGAVSPNEARDEWFGLGPVPGGESPLAQQQYYTLQALALREPPSAPSVPSPPQPSVEEASGELVP